jgi:hypothetical protein
VSGTINTAMNGTGKKISNLAQKVRDRAPAGAVGEAASATADAIDRSGSYLQDHDVAGVRGNLEKLIRRYPLRSLLISAIISFVLARRMPH